MLHLAFADGQRRQDLDDIHVVPGHLGEHAVLAEQRHDDELREK